MTDLAVIESGIPRLLSLREAVLVPASADQPGRKVPVSALLLWTSAERLAIGVKTIVDDPIPARKIVTSCTAVGR